jgi:hypothetical protein
MHNRRMIFWLITSILANSMLACSGISVTSPTPQELPSSTAALDREASIPVDAVKMSPETDQHPPLLYSGEYENPIPLPGAVNTAGAEDSPFITPDGKTFYFFFTPDVEVPAEEQLLDGITGIYASHKVNGEWAKPERIMLQESGKLALDGCEFVAGEIMWFCSAREGFSGIHWFNARHENGRWQNWQIADFDPSYQVGELHITSDGAELYFGSERPGGKGQLDIWVSKNLDGIWQEPGNVSAVNTADSEGWPAISTDGDELWFYRNYGIWRSKKVNGEWQAAELIVSPLAGEPSIDGAGNLYFTHHFYADDRMIEADIYVAYKK